VPSFTRTFRPHLYFFFVSNFLHNPPQTSFGRCTNFSPKNPPTPGGVFHGPSADHRLLWSKFFWPVEWRVFLPPPGHAPTTSNTSPVPAFPALSSSKGDRPLFYVACGNPPLFLLPRADCVLRTSWVFSFSVFSPRTFFVEKILEFFFPPFSCRTFILPPF